MLQYICAVVSRVSLVDWLLLLFGVILILYIVGTWNYDYFQTRGIPSTKPRIPFFGDLMSVFLSRRSLADVTEEQYKMGEGHGVFGIFEFTSPAFLVRDPEILKIITVKEFDNFMNHRSVLSEVTDPIFSKNLINLKDQHWRDMRATLSPAFTTSKIKAMFPLISECGDQIVQHLRDKYANSKQGTQNGPMEIDMKDLFTRMANDVIATAAFGLSCDSLKNPQNEFYRVGKELTSFSKIRSLLFLGFMVIPKLMEALRFRVLDGKATNFFDSLVHDTIRERKQRGIFRPDVLQLLMQAREGELKAEEADKSEAEDVGAKKKLTDDELSAQAVIFFFAGFETVSTALCLITYVLSHHREEQKRLQTEIAKMMKKTGGKPTYEAVQSMKYLDAVVNETLRLYPVAVATDRLCREDTVLPAGNYSNPFTVRKGHTISIPIVGLHHDPQYWDEPEKFNPDRFSDENKHKIKPFTYMPFGVGPRLCIGQRFALIEAKLGLVHLLANFDLYPGAKTKHPLQFEPGFNIMAKGGFWCGITPRKE